MNDKLNTAINKYAVPILASKYTVPILAFVGAIGTTVATCTGSNPQVAGIIGSLLTSVIGNKITNIELINRLKRTSPKNLNHDVLKISGEAVKQTVKWIADSYQEEVKDKLSENELKEIDGKLTEIINDTNSQIDSENWIKELNTKDVINYVNDFNNQVNLTNLSFETIDNLVIDNPFSKFFDEHFQEYFKLYFGELLKQDKCRPALIAYEREIQKMILDAVTQNSDKLAEKIDFTQEEIEKLRKSLDSQEIVSAIRTDIQQYIKELSPQVVSQDIQEDIRREAQKIDSYFKAKKIIIKEIKQDKLLIEIPNKDIIEIGNDYYKLKELTAEIYYFEYNNRLYSIDELEEEAFDYITGKIKYNQIFTKRIIEAIKDECSNQHQNFYRVIEQTGSHWDTTPRFCDEGKHIISDSFIGIIGKQLNKLFAIGKDTGEPEEITRKKYIEKCNYIVRRTLDLVIFSFLSQLWDDVCNRKMTFSGKNPLPGHFTMNLNGKEQLALLLRLINLYAGNEPDNSLLLLPEILEMAACFNEDGELYVCCTELEKSHENPNILDCYHAEKQLTVFFEHFRFLVNYKMASMKKIEYFNIKKIDAGYLHHYVNLGYSRKSLEVEERNFDDCHETINSLFTNAVLLYKGKAYTCNINLFPFVIDYNALTLEHNSQIAFFRQPAFDEDSLEYSFLDTDEPFELEYKGIVQQKGGNKKVIYLTDDDMKIYNRDCVLTTFRMIQESLFI